MSSLYQQLNPTKQLPGNILDKIKQFKMMSNPQTMVQQLMQQNPQVSSLIQAANGDPEKAFRDLAKKMNVDPEQILSALK